ncbi:hypothetical protein NC653_013583 [Populus alba x Populus x berolinensis]|uniref:Uncharacterized protein n=1 Tax=Populus alba x Populus x berolinensis TaxID=444605 RepID=A0AAD6W3Q9_9ROSI|nr:hypothetical protein NC653_013583 [Populus alba x Populus x berolinensis]
MKWKPEQIQNHHLSDGQSYAKPFLLRKSHENSGQAVEDHVNEESNYIDVCICYALPDDASPKLSLSKLDNGADLSDFEVSNRYSVDNTGPVCKFCLCCYPGQWPSEDVLSYFCLSHADMFRFHDKLDIQHSIDASSTAFGNTKLKTMTLHWDEEVTYNISNTFDVIVARDL